MGRCDDAVAFLPLVLWCRNWKSAWQRLLVPVGYSDYDYHDPIFVGSEGEGHLAIDFWEALAAHLQSEMGLSFDYFVADGVRSLSAGQGMGWDDDGICPWSDLTRFRSPEEFLPSLKSSLRGDLRRLQRRITEAGGFTVITYGTDQVAEALHELPAFLEAHARRWPNAYKVPHFHENLLRLGIPSGIVLFRVMKIGGETAAWHLGFSFHRRFYSYMPAMIERFSNLSPGKMMILYRYEQSIAAGDEVFDHLRGTEPYKEEWATEKQFLRRFNLTGEGLAAQFRNAFVNIVKPVIARV